MAAPDTSHDIDLRRGFRRAGSALFWLSAAVVMMLWAAQKAGLIALGAGLGLLAFIVLFIGFSASSSARMIGVAMDVAARSGIAKQGAARLTDVLAQIGWLPRLLLTYLPGANLLTFANILSSIHDGSIIEQVRGTFQQIGMMLGGGLMGVGAAAASWHWWHGAERASLHSWLVVAGIGVALMLLFLIAAGWVAQGFRPQATRSEPRPGASP